MYKVLIVDDEPLARIGITSMLSSFEELEILPSASNGQIALDIINVQHPDIVISDIKMPVMDGLHLLKEVSSCPEPKPVFIMLTSYDEFEYVRTSINYDACYYLMKMELNRDTLSCALDKAFSRLEARNRQITATADDKSNNLFLNRFYFNLLTYTYHTEEMIRNTAQKFDLDLAATCYLTVAVHLEFENDRKQEHIQTFASYAAVIAAIRESLTSHYKCHFVAWNQDTIGIIVQLESHNIDFLTLKDLFLRSCSLTMQYFGCSLYFGIGKKVTSLLSLSDSFATSLSVLSGVNFHKLGQRFFYYKGSDSDRPDSTENQFMSVQNLNRHLVRAFDNCDCEIFNDTINDLLPMIAQWSSNISIGYVSSIIHIIIQCLNDGENMLNEAFSEGSHSYQVLYTYRTPEEIIAYVKRLRNCTLIKMNSMKSDPKYKLVLTAQNYIRDHIYDKLTLNETAAAVGVSPNYLSTLFSTYSDLGFSDYVIHLKVKKAREILSHRTQKVYEVSQLLGFENPHYFSKVYKKFTGFSPTETPFSKNQE